ncbi:MAG: HAMP domain-containing sensor histidine kinase [Oscillospiraceae bacterium]
MKLTTKIILFIIVLLTVVFTFGGYFMISRNFERSLNLVSRQNVNQYITEKFLIEKNISELKLKKGELTRGDITSVLNSVFEYTGNAEIGLYDKYGNAIETRMNQNVWLPLEQVKLSDGIAYEVKKMGDDVFMFIYSVLQLTDQSTVFVARFDITSVFDERNLQYQFFLILAATLIGISCIVIIIFSGFVTKSLKKLIHTSKKIAAGAYGERTNINSLDEIGELSKSFDLMAAEIENKINELTTANENKNEFITNFTHELKTPMTSIMGYADMLRSKEYEPQIQIRAANSIFKESKRINELSLKLMDLFSLSSEYVSIVPVPADKILSSYSKDFQKCNVLADITLIEIVLRNLYQNAKNAEAKTILVTGKIVHDKYEISVTDDGLGMKKSELEKITQPFYVVDKSRSREKGGSGIGLSLCEKIAVLHGSPLEVKSEIGKGTTVKFYLEVIHDEA